MRLKRNGALFVLVVALATSVLAGEKKYIVTNIGTLPGGGNSQANGLNTSGDAVGKATDVNNGYNDTAVLFTGGILYNIGGLDLPFALSSEAMAINDFDVIVGDTSNGVPHAFMVDGQTVHSLETLPDTYSSQPFSINNGGLIVGSVSLLINPNTVAFHAFRSDGQSMEDLNPLLGDLDYSEAFGINDAGQIVGVRRFGQDGDHAFLLDGKTVTDLGAGSAGNSVAYAINSVGQVVGVVYAGGAGHPFLYQNGALQDLGLLPGAIGGFATSINATGDLVGTMRFPGNSQSTRGFIYRNGALADLNDSLLPDSGWLLQTATGINASGQISGRGLFNGAIRGFVLQPTSLGDLNCDGLVDFADIDPFVLALTNGAAYAAAYPHCDRNLADCNQDGYVDFTDIDPFVALLSG